MANLPKAVQSAGANSFHSCLDSLFLRCRGPITGHGRAGNHGTGLAQAMGGGLAAWVGLRCRPHAGVTVQPSQESLTFHSWLAPPTLRRARVSWPCGHLASREGAAAQSLQRRTRRGGMRRLSNIPMSQTVGTSTDCSPILLANMSQGASASLASCRDPDAHRPWVRLGPDRVARDGPLRRRSVVQTLMGRCPSASNRARSRSGPVPRVQDVRAGP
jgi:hypothetical protein